METPDASLDAMTNDWVRYQAIAARLWGRAGYYQQSGAFGFRDQLQDSQVWLTIDPERCRRQLELHAKHQFADGSVYHWWHPLTEQGHVTKMTDDLLWLAFVAASYIRETGDASVLRDTAPYLDEKTPAPLSDHALRAFRRVFQRTSPRGIPLIGAGDWNDGLSAMGLREKGESFWLAQFLAGLLADWSEIWKRARTCPPSSATGAPRSSPRSTRTAGTGSGTCAARSTTAARSGPRATAWAGSS
jgi:cellobiose phosphorylase